ncbi:tRNA threonylcarbamoyl adenosine modification protein YeaZ [Cognatiyoonia koreensis]|uniref:tRNA threonylcarbamoyl adenosine modification protein YeaZ n=1 Tax=Cognatiyoonia koreensis TaxID=364200 RepID=A0A1I0QLU9_9RHOB|nr:tRNA (adenosine(37)-N6)-threonylcarbamoyltransferase complex dimerization subunit type 1 TsaB [Cognatiyoonia koreensis]SEW28063.1 tRNA threonylcarbamoyl adenosine modification protein YeaZ [Cognatiyoonia koreensis]
MTPPVILAFDTAGPHCAAALWRDGHVIGSRHEEMKRGQAERLMVLIEELLGENQITWADIGLVAVGIGPGNFTGIRISVAAARGIGLGCGIPVMGVSQFEVSRGPDSPNLRDASVASVPGPRDSAYVQEFCDGKPAGPPTISENCMSLVAAHAPAPTIAQIAAQRWAAGETTPDRPAPLYVRAADAAPPRDLAPVILS